MLTRDSVAPAAFFQGMDRSLYITNPSFASSASSSSVSTVTNQVTDMEKPVISFRQFVKNNAPVVHTHQSQPRMRRASSFYGPIVAIDLAPAESVRRASRRRSSEFFLQPVVFSWSTSNLPHRDSRGYLESQEALGTPSESVESAAASLSRLKLLAPKDDSRLHGRPAAEEYRASNFAPPADLFDQYPASPAFDLADAVCNNPFLPQPGDVPAPETTFLQRDEGSELSVEEIHDDQHHEAGFHQEEDSTTPTKSHRHSQVNFKPTALTLKRQSNNHSPTTPSQYRPASFHDHHRHTRNVSSIDSAISFFSSLTTKKTPAYPNTPAGRLRAHLPLRIPTTAIRLRRRSGSAGTNTPPSSSSTRSRKSPAKHTPLTARRLPDTTADSARRGSGPGPEDIIDAYARARSPVLRSSSPSPSPPSAYLQQSRAPYRSNAQSDQYHDQTTRSASNPSKQTMRGLVHPFVPGPMERLPQRAQPTGSGSRANSSSSSRRRRDKLSAALAHVVHLNKPFHAHGRNFGGNSGRKAQKEEEEEQEQRRARLKRQIRVVGDVDPRALLTAQALGAVELGRIGGGAHVG